MGQTAKNEPDSAPADAPEEQLPDDSPRPENVVQALAWVMARMGGVRKLTAQDRQARGMGGGDTGVSYAYRGIDQIAQVAQPLLGQAGVVMVPRILSRETVDITVRGNPWTDTIVMVEWSVYGPGGVNDVLLATTEGWGRDNSDKGINKAMTGAFKNLLLRILCVGDPQDDTDGHTHEADRREPQQDPAAITYQRVVDFAKNRPEAMPELRKLGDERGRKFTVPAYREDPDWRAEVDEWLDNVRVIGLSTEAPAEPAVEPVEAPASPAAEGDSPEPAEAPTVAEVPEGECEFCHEQIREDGTCGCAPAEGQG